jgi:hypothetical protein
MTPLYLYCNNFNSFEEMHSLNVGRWWLMMMFKSTFESHKSLMHATSKSMQVNIMDLNSKYQRSSLYLLIDSIKFLLINSYWLHQIRIASGRQKLMNQPRNAKTEFFCNNYTNNRMSATHIDYPAIIGWLIENMSNLLITMWQVLKSKSINKSTLINVASLVQILVVPTQENIPSMRNHSSGFTLHKQSLWRGVVDPSFLDLHTHGTRH